LFTGAPGPRDQHFIQHAYIVLERERQDTVRAAALVEKDGDPRPLVRALRRVLNLDQAGSGKKPDSDGPGFDPEQPGGAD
jgi:hypothetical protein